MQTVSCPSCGAEVKFRSHASVMAVCEYCNTRVLKEAGAVRDLGKISSVLEDYSPIQIGSSGSLAGRAFTVVGRIQLRYSAGMWNEWYLQFDDASTGWLGDASGQYTATSLRPSSPNPPAFEELRPGRQYNIDGEPFTAADIRTAECIGGQGELPFKVGDGWQAKVADFRRGAAFVTLDYSDEGPPLVYAGVPVTLEQMQMQLLRDDDQIRQSAGRYRGKLDKLDCPSCGSAIQYLPGMTANLVCQSCHAQLDASSPKVEVLEAGESVEAQRFTLEPGATGKLGSQEFTVLGAMRRADDEGTVWTEYLLYGPRAGFTWLVETDEGWSRANVLDEWPEWAGGPATLNKIEFEKLYEYESTVRYAAGAFNWRVSVGDRTRVAEFRRQQISLAAELTGEEMTWSRSTPVAFDQLKSWFGNSVRGSAPPRAAQGDTLAARAGRYKRTAKGFVTAMLMVNAVPLLATLGESGFGSQFAYSALGAIAIYLPAIFLDSVDKS
jgi:ribosomal protein S27E